MRLPARAALLVGIWLALSSLPVSAIPPPPRETLGDLRLLYLASVENGSALPRARREIERLRAAMAPPAGSELDPILTAYAGALTTLEAKHAPWPPQKLRLLRAGFATLDSVVEQRPDAVEPRYLRLMIGNYLPGFLGRSQAVRADFLALAQLLPAARSRYPAELYRAIASFVVEHGGLSPADRSALERSLGR